MESKTRILMIATNLGLNGISSVIMNYCRNIDLNKYDITIMAGNPIDDLYESECNKLGIHIIELPARKPTTKEYYKVMYKKILKNRFDIIHVHGNSSALTIELLFAWIKGIRIRIAHCHNSTCTNIRAHKILLPFFNFLCTQGLSCSSLAGKWLFKNNNYSIMPNGFEVDKFRFDISARKKIRNILGINENDFLIGHIGRFNGQKNQEFLLKVFEHVAKENRNAWIVFVGNGPDFNEFNRLVKNHPFKERIIIYGETTEVNELYSAMDLFAFPSKYEGLGIVTLEAQISGLRCIVSNEVPRDVAITNNIEFFSIKEKDIRIWAEYILDCINDGKKNINIDIQDSKVQMYNIKENVKILECMYHNLMNIYYR